MLCKHHCYYMIAYFYYFYVIQRDFFFRSISDTDTDGHSNIFNHKNGLLSGNNFVPQYPNKFQHDSYMMQPQPNEESMYREQPQIGRSDWPQMIPQQPQVQTQPKPNNAIWPKQLPIEEVKVSDRKNVQKDYSDEEYTDGDENQAENDEATTTEPPKKVFEVTLICVIAL